MKIIIRLTQCKETKLAEKAILNDVVKKYV